MIHALQEGLGSGYKRVMIIGSDAPTLPAAHVSALLAADADITFGPAEDGGFYAISARRVHPAMFNGVVWSQPDTLLRHIEAVRQCGLSVAVGPRWFDVDDPATSMLLAGNRSARPHGGLSARLRAEQPDTCRCAESVD